MVFEGKEDWRTMRKEDAQKMIDEMAMRAGSALSNPNDPLHGVTVAMENAHMTYVRMEKDSSAREGNSF
jgi:hypothetical protein